MKNLFYVAIVAVMLAACTGNVESVEETVAVDSVEVVADTTVAPADVTVTEVAE
jgi:uncharacterized protein YcfL